MQTAPHEPNQTFNWSFATVGERTAVSGVGADLLAYNGRAVEIRGDRNGTQLVHVKDLSHRPVPEPWVWDSLSSDMLGILALRIRGQRRVDWGGAPTDPDGLRLPSPALKEASDRWGMQQSALCDYDYK